MKKSDTRLWHIVGQAGTLVVLAGVVAWLLFPANLLAAILILFVGLLIVIWSLYKIGEVHTNELTAEHAWRRDHGLEGDSRR